MTDVEMNRRLATISAADLETAMFLVAQGNGAYYIKASTGLSIAQINAVFQWVPLEARKYVK